MYLKGHSLGLIMIPKGQKKKHPYTRHEKAHFWLLRVIQVTPKTVYIIDVVLGGLSGLKMSPISEDTEYLGHGP